MYSNGVGHRGGWFWGKGFMLMKGQEVALTVAWGLAGGARVWVGDGKGAQSGELRLQWKVLRFSAG